MRILLYGLNFSPEPTGIGKYSGELAEALVAAGHEVRIVAAPPYYPQWRVANGYRRWWYQTEAVSTNLRVTRCPLWVPKNPNGFARLLHLLSFAISSVPAVLRQRLWRPEALIVVVPTLFCVPGAVLAMLGSRAKRIVHVQDLEVDAAFELGVIRWRLLRTLILGVERWLLDRFDVVSSVSRRMLERLAEKGIRQEKFMLLPNWIHTDRIRPSASATTFRFEWGLESESVVVLYAGSLGEKQGIDTLLEAAARAGSGNSIKFLVCSDGPAYRRLRTEYAHLGNVVWSDLVPQERLNDLLNLADIHVLPQRADAADLVMPSKLTGMLASGRPVVATAAPGTQVAEIVEGRGIVVPPGDSEALRGAILRLAEDKPLRERLGAAAREYAVRHLDQAIILSRFERELSGLVAGPAAIDPD
jgi:colanic acid biosynthesis glycosyl transferase WcaI